jgi:hypothetical protein
MDREPIATGRLPPLGGWSYHLCKHRGRSPDPSKTHPGHDVMVAGLAGAISLRDEIQLREQWRSGDQAGTTAAPWRGARPFEG